MDWILRTMLRRYFYGLLARYISVYVRPGDSLTEIDPGSDELGARFPQRSISRSVAWQRSSQQGDTATASLTVDFVLLQGNLHYERDIQSYLKALHRVLDRRTRLILIYYSALWKPAMRLASFLGFRRRMPETNWLAHSDIANLLHLCDFEVVRGDSRILVPVYIPILSTLLNRYLAPLPFFRLFTMVNLLVARPLVRGGAARPSVSVVVPARNEAGNIAEIVRRLPAMGPDDELIFVEGGSKDDTWRVIQETREACSGSRPILAVKQDGKGKGDAVRKGFALASKEVLMILDADMTVPPEDLPKFYEALVMDKGEFINGSRLVYPMEKRAMRFINLLGNKFFAASFSYVLGQRFKDTLCGTKVLTRANYERLAAHRGFFGDFDPFGDFDLIFGAARMGLRVIEVPIAYRDRSYGETNISRWRHGALLLTMLLFSARKLKFI